MWYEKIFWQLLKNEFIIQLLLASLFFVPWKKRRSFFVLRYLFSIAVIICFGNFIRVPMPWHYLVMFVLMNLLILFCFKCNFIESLFFAVNTYCTQHIISALSYGLGFLLVLNQIPFKAYHIISPIVTALVFTAVYFFITRKLSKENQLNFSSPTIVYAFTFFVLIAVFLTHYAQATVPDRLNTQIYIKIISMLYGIATLAINVMNCNNKKLEKEKNILQILLNKDEQRYEQAKLSNEKISIKYHDLKQKERQGVVEHEDMAEIDKDKDILQNTYFTKNKALDILLTEKSRICEKANIRFICSADGKALDFIKPYHIYSLLGNALDNAIESLTKIIEQDKKELTATITKRGDMCLIRVCNYVQSEIVIEKGLPITSKRDKENHGYGVKSMKNIAEMYNGEIYFSTEDNIFTLLIMMTRANLKKNVA